MKFSVGYQENPEWIDAIFSNRAAIHDCYFSFGAMPSGRQGVCDPLRQLDDLGRLVDGGIDLNILFNANCYGARAESKAFFGEVGEALERFSEGGALKSVTTTSPLVARFVKENFPALKTRASVNMEIGTVEGMEYLADRFDGYYVKRETDEAKIAARWNWVKPEDIHLYEGLVTAAKLATRINVNPVRVLESYVSGSHAGNMLDLLEPNHSSVLKDKFNLVEDETCSPAR